MSVQDDANAVRMTHSTSSFGRAALWAALAGVVAVALAPAAWFPYRAHLEVRSRVPPFSDDEKRALERAGLRLDQRRGPGDSWRIEARAPGADAVESVLAEAAARALARPADPAAKETALPASEPPPSRSAQTATWLMGEAGALERGVARMGEVHPVTLAAPSSALIRLRGSLAVLDADHARAAQELDPGRLAHLSRVMPATEAAWARAAAQRAGEVGSVALEVERALLRVRWLRRAGLDRRTAEALLARRPVEERARAQATAAALAAQLAEALPAAGDPARDATVTAWVSPARRPIVPRVATGLIAAAVTLVAVRMLGSRRRVTARSARPEIDGGGGSSLREFTIHWVSAPSARESAAAAVRLTAQALQEVERVLLVDAGGRTRLDRVLEREDRWGLAECARDRLPVLGLVQDGGYPGLFLLAHGEGRAQPDWKEVARVLSGVRIHFDRTIICVEPRQLREAARLLAADGFAWWWGRPPGGRRARPRWLVESLGNSCCDIEVPASLDRSLELLSRAAHRPLRARPQAPPAGVVLPAPVSVELPTPVPIPEPALDCDLQVGERLRFLAWVRQLHEELPAATTERMPIEEDVVASR